MYLEKKSNPDTNPNEQLSDTKDATKYYKTLLHPVCKNSVMGFVL